jgi:hypothetical protein
MLEKYLTRHASPQGFDFTAVNLKIKKMQKSSAQCGFIIIVRKYREGTNIRYNSVNPRRSAGAAVFVPRPKAAGVADAMIEARFLIGQSHLYVLNALFL